MGNVVVYTKTNCIQCKMTKKFLTEHNINFEEKNISTDPSAVSYLKDQGFLSVPVVFENDAADPIVGFRPDRLKGLVK